MAYHAAAALDKRLVQVLAFCGQLGHVRGDAFLCRLAVLEVAVCLHHAVGEIIADVQTLQAQSR